MQLAEILSSALSASSPSLGSLQFSLDRQDLAAGFQLVMVDVAKFDQAFQKDSNFYIGQDGVGGIGKRYAAFGKWIEANNVLAASSVAIAQDGSVSFNNGRHRYAYLRDHGFTKMPIAMDQDSIKLARKYRLLADR
jgi:hypothetical protein